MAEIGWGIIGCGDVAEKKSGPALARTPGSRLVAVMRRDLAKAEDFARRHGAARAYDSVESLLGDGEVQAVYVATPPHLHAEQVMQTARAGIKHILVEKPLARTAAEAEAMLAVCRETGTTLHAAYYRRFWPRFRAVRECVASGALGTLVGARLLLCTNAGEAGWRTDPRQSGGGHFVDVGSHRLDMLLFLLGDPSVANAAGFAAKRARLQSAVETDVALSFQTDSGIVVSASFHFAVQGMRRDVLEIYGTHGALRLDPFDGDTFTVANAAGQATVSEAFAPVVPTHGPLVAALISAYRGESLIADAALAEQGLKTTRLMETALQAFYADADARAANQSSASKTAT